MRKLLPLALLCIPVALLAAQNPSDSSNDPQKSLDGSYQLTAGEKNGEKVPAERLKDNTTIISNNTLAIVDRDRQELYSATFSFPKEQPPSTEKIRHIDFVSKVPKEGVKALGLVKQDGDQVWIIYDMTGKRPEGFEKTKQGQHLFKMKRTAKNADLNKPAEKKD